MNVLFGSNILFSVSKSNTDTNVSIYGENQSVDLISLNQVFQVFSIVLPEALIRIVINSALVIMSFGRNSLFLAINPRLIAFLR